MASLGNLAVCKTLDPYLPSGKGFGVSFENWNKEKTIDAVIKVFDYIVPQILVVAKAMVAFAILAAAYASQQKGGHAFNAKDLKSKGKEEEVESAYSFQLSKAKTRYLIEQIVRAGIAFMLSPGALVAVDVIVSYYAPENVSLVEQAEKFMLNYLPDSQTQEA